MTLSSNIGNITSSLCLYWSCTEVCSRIAHSCHAVMSLKSLNPSLSWSSQPHMLKLSHHVMQSLLMVVIAINYHGPRHPNILASQYMCWLSIAAIRSVIYMLNSIFPHIDIFYRSHVIQNIVSNVAIRNLVTIDIKRLHKDHGTRYLSLPLSLPFQNLNHLHQHTDQKTTIFSRHSHRPSNITSTQN